MALHKPNEVRRHEILRAAIQEFAFNGYNHASMERIAKLAGITKSGVYHYYKSKSEILIAAYELAYEPIWKLMEDVSQFENVVAKLQYFVNGALYYWFKNKSDLYTVLVLMVFANQDDAMRTSVHNVYARITLFINELYEKGVQRGELWDSEGMDMGYTLNLFVDGAIGRMLAQKEVNFLEIQKYVQMLFDKLFKTGYESFHARAARIEDWMKK
jgi:AcrR family transcriptional regulator